MPLPPPPPAFKIYALYTRLREATEVSQQQVLLGRSQTVITSIC